MVTPHPLLWRWWHPGTKARLIWSCGDVAKHGDVGTLGPSVHFLEIHTESLSIFVHLMVEMVTLKYTEMHKSFIALVIRGQ